MEYLDLKVKEVRKETNDAISVHFEQPSDKKINYLPGQFLTFIFDINGKEERRAYSLCSSPYTDSDLSVAVKRVDKGLISNHINDTVKAGDTLKIAEPMGTFTIEPDQSKQRHIVLLGGGSGITPLLSIMKSILKEEPQSVISLVYANKDKDSVIFSKEIASLQSEYANRLKVVHYLDAENEGKKKLFKKNTPFLTKQKLKDILNSELLLENTDPLEFFICGPQGMMKVAEDTLISLSFPSSTIKKESFVSFGSETNESGSGETRTVKVKYLGQEYSVEVQDGIPLLQAAMSSGVDLPFSCQSGLCTACMGKLIQGKLEMRDNMALTDSEIQNGFVLTCVGHPTTNDVIVEIE